MLPLHRAVRAWCKILTLIGNGIVAFEHTNSKQEDLMR